MDVDVTSSNPVKKIFLSNVIPKNFTRNIINYIQHPVRKIYFSQSLTLLLSLSKVKYKS